MHGQYAMYIEYRRNNIHDAKLENEFSIMYCLYIRLAVCYATRTPFPAPLPRNAKKKKSNKQTNNPATTPYDAFSFSNTSVNVDTSSA